LVKNWRLQSITANLQKYLLLFVKIIWKYKKVMYLYITKQIDMTTITNTTGSKAVNIKTDAIGNVIAMYVQVYNNEQQVLQSKSFSTVKNAEKWAKKILS